MSQVTVRSFVQVLSEVRENIEIECFDSEQRAAAEEICLIIAEVHMLPSECKIRIGGEELPKELVSQVYSRLTCEHVRSVIEKFSRADYRINRKKTYLRTALYNEVFEHESEYVNSFSRLCRSR